MSAALSMTPEAWQTWMKQAGQPAFRAGQVFGWLHKGVDFAEMSNLPKALRDALAAEFGAVFPQLSQKQVSSDGTVKYLWRMADGQCVESVAMRYKYGVSACLSSQVGCRMGCAFCATAKNGLTRDLTAGEILGQLLAMGREGGQMPVKLVLMGMGEPLDNVDNVLAFLQLAHEPRGLNMSYRHMSLSTCGLEKGLQRLLESKLPLTLSVSLHAPDDETRSAIMPSNRALGVDKLINYIKMYSEETGRRVTVEYVMIQGVTDFDSQADRLAAFFRHTPIHVNLIALNTVEGSDLRPTERRSIEAFAARLAAKGVNTTVRRTLGDDIDAACGQLRAKSIQGKDDDPC